MSWSPNDLLSDSDLLSYEGGILESFAKTNWLDKRRKAIEDWMFPILRVQGFTPERFRTRYEPCAVYGYTASTYSYQRANAISQTEDDINLATVFATPGTDVLYIGSDKQFRGLSVRMLAGVSAVAGTMTVSLWQDAWVNAPIQNGTLKTAGKPFSGGGAVTWDVPQDWVVRRVNASAYLYWAKVVLSATPTAATTCQIGVIRRSVLCAPLTLRTLSLIMREAPTSAAGPWTDKATYYEQEADAALQRALSLVGGEFDTDENDLISDTEAAQTNEDAGGASSGGHRMERY